jgi:hypothetical protein
MRSAAGAAAATPRWAPAQVLDAVGRGDVLVADLVRHVLLVGAGRERRRDARVAQRARGDLLTDRGQPGLRAPAVASCKTGGITCWAIALRVRRLPRACRNAGPPGSHVSPRATMYAASPSCRSSWMSTRRTPAGILASSTRRSRRARSTCSQLSAHISLARRPDRQAHPRRGDESPAISSIPPRRAQIAEIGSQQRIPRRGIASRAFASSAAADRTTENRGVPGSSPGLAIEEIPGNGRFSDSQTNMQQRSDWVPRSRVVPGLRGTA